MVALTLGLAMAGATAVKAQDKLEAHAKADFVSSYIWRGADQGHGFAVQPSLTLGWQGFTLNAWGSTPMSDFAEKNTPKEFDINLGYAIGGLSLTVTDYWWGGKQNPYGWYGSTGYDNDVNNGHHFEGTVAYNFGEKVPLTLSWSTWFAGADAVNKDGDRLYSTYISAAYNISLPADVTLTPAIGFTPWKGYYHEKAGVTDISLKASKDVKVTENFSIPVFVQAIASPVYDKTNVVAGFSLGF